MDHSLESYLQQLSSEELLTFLRQCMQQCQWSSYAYVIPQILEILQVRGFCVPKPILDAWEAYLQA